MEAIKKSLDKQHNFPFSKPIEGKKVSFRDPSGSLYLGSEKVTRIVKRRGMPDLQSLFVSPTFKKHVTQTNIIASHTINQTDHCLTLEHPKVFFPSYPNEWVPEMLADAASLTLQLAEEFLHEGMGLKDATPRNILFKGATPIFVDVLSFEKRHPNDATWRPFEQFCKTFLYPLIAHQALGTSLQATFANDFNGILPQDLLRQLHPLQRFHPRYFSLVTVPGILASMTEKAKQKGNLNRFTSSKEEARFVLKILLKHLRRGLERVCPSSLSSSHWKSYVDQNCPYSQKELGIKKNAIEQFLTKQTKNTVLDLGANTGTFSVLAAKTGKKVVSVEADTASVSALYAQAKAKQLDILPLHMDLLNPSPARGWNGAETFSFFERAGDSFDTVMMLALIHHLMGDGIALSDIFDFAARITTKNLIMEYIPTSDQNYKNIIAKRGDAVPQPSQEEFEATALQHFLLKHKVPVSESGRALYFFEKIPSL